jgi:glycosyltransferase involved in cell wall biosynthesis
LRVGLNTAIKRRGTSGTARLVEHIERALNSSPEMDLVNVHPAGRPQHGRFKRAFSSASWDLWSAARSVSDLDAFVSPCNTGRAPRGTPHLLWMLDTMVLDHPEWYDPAFAAYARLLFGYSARASTRVVTISRHSARRIEARWPGTAPVEVIRLPAELRESSPRRMPDRRLTVLMVGATEVHKNHAAAIEAVRQAREASEIDLRLVVVGPAGRAEAQVRERGLRADPTGDWFERRVDVPEHELRECYRTAWVLLHAALDEGFGLPLLEASGYGLPVVHSGRGGMNEVVSTGTVESVDSEELCHGLLELLDGSEYARRSAAVLEDAQAQGPAEFRHELVRMLRETAG